MQAHDLAESMADWSRTSGEEVDVVVVGIG